MGGGGGGGGILRKKNGFWFLNFLSSLLVDSFGPRAIYMIPLNQKFGIYDDFFPNFDFGFMNLKFSLLVNSFGPRAIYMIPLNQKETPWW